MKTNKYDFLANMFTGSDTARVALFAPGEIENMVYGTDAHTCIRFDKNLANINYSKNDKFPNASAIFDKLDLDTTEILIVEDLMLQIYDCQAEFENKFETCGDCHGDGEHVCSECDNESDCKKCKGTGTLVEEAPYAKITCIGDDINFLNKKVGPKYIYKVIQVALILNQQKIEIKYSNHRLELLFKVADVEILVMSKHIHSEL